MIAINPSTLRIENRTASTSLTFATADNAERDALCRLAGIPAISVLPGHELVVRSSDGRVSTVIVATVRHPDEGGILVDVTGELPVGPIEVVRVLRPATFNAAAHIASRWAKACKED